MSANELGSNPEARRFRVEVRDGWLAESWTHGRKFRLLLISTNVGPGGGSSNDVMC